MGQFKNILALSVALLSPAVAWSQTATELQNHKTQYMRARLAGTKLMAALPNKLPAPKHTHTDFISPFTGNRAAKATYLALRGLNFEQALAHVRNQGVEVKLVSLADETLKGRYTPATSKSRALIELDTADKSLYLFALQHEYLHHVFQSPHASLPADLLAKQEATRAELRKLHDDLHAMADDAPEAEATSLLLIEKLLKLQTLRWETHKLGVSQEYDVISMQNEMADQMALSAKHRRLLIDYLGFKTVDFQKTIEAEGIDETAREVNQNASAQNTAILTNLATYFETLRSAHELAALGSTYYHHYNALLGEPSR